MIKYTLLFIAIFCCAGEVPAQDTTLQRLVQKGIKYYDQGKFYDALIVYDQALDIDSNSATVYFEIANTYESLHNYEKSLEFSNRVLSLNKEELDRAYIVKCNALEKLKRYDEAIVTYRQGLKQFPNDHMMLYYAARLLLNTKKYEESAELAERAVVANPKHSGSHSVLGVSKGAINQRSKSVLALYYYLFLEPMTKNSKEGFAALVTNTTGYDGNKKSGAVKPAKKKEKDVFTGLDEQLNKQVANKPSTGIAENEEAKLVAFTQSFLTMVDGMAQNERDKSIWWTLYAPFFHELQASKNTEAFCYFISALKNSENYKAWTESHRVEMEKFISWRDGYLHKSNQ